MPLKNTEAESPPAEANPRNVARGFHRRRNFLVATAALIVIVVGLLIVLRSRDGQTAGSGPRGLVGGDFHSLVVDPTTSDRLYVGGHEAVSVSPDRGNTWSEVAPLRNGDAMGWAFSNDTIYVSGHPGVGRSDDGGATFRLVNENLPDTDVHAFGGSDDVLYGAGPSGLFTSRDAGASWAVRSSEAGRSFFGRIVVDPADDEHLFAADVANGVAESVDGGATWRYLDTGLARATWMSASGNDLRVLVASGPDGAVRSQDGGGTWARLELPPGATLIEVDPQTPDVLYAGIHSGESVQVLVSEDGGSVWAEAAG